MLKKVLGARVRGAECGAVIIVALLVWCAALTSAQAPARPQRVETTMLQLMRGIFYPAANVFFAAQTVDPATIQKAHDPAISPDPLTSSYGQWLAIENAALAMAEASNLLNLPGRFCSNGKPVPVQNADWLEWVEEMREAGKVAFKAAQSKNNDRILEAADVVAEACRHCHVKYRDVPGGLRNRC
jgi:hypothetical protein